MSRYRYVFASKKSTGEVAILEVYEGILIDKPAEFREEVEALCGSMNQEDSAAIAEWEKLDRLDLDTDPFVMGRQAVSIGVGCPFRPGTDAHAEFMRGQRLQKYLKQ